MKTLASILDKIEIEATDDYRLRTKITQTDIAEYENTLAGIDTN